MPSCVEELDCPRPPSGLPVRLPNPAMSFSPSERSVSASERAWSSCRCESLPRAGPLLLLDVSCALLPREDPAPVVFERVSPSEPWPSGTSPSLRAFASEPAPSCPSPAPRTSALPPCEAREPVPEPGPRKASPCPFGILSGTDCSPMPPPNPGARGTCRRSSVEPGALSPADSSDCPPSELSGEGASPCPSPTPCPAPSPPPNSLPCSGLIAASSVRVLRRCSSRMPASPRSASTRSSTFVGSSPSCSSTMSSERYTPWFFSAYAHIFLTRLRS